MGVSRVHEKRSKSHFSVIKGLAMFERKKWTRIGEGERAFCVANLRGGEDGLSSFSKMRLSSRRKISSK